MKPPTILVVDDQPVNVKLLTGILSAEGYSLIEAYNGKEAIEAAKQQRPDLVLLDVMMPDVDGFQVCRSLKEDEKTRFIPVLMVTALQEKEHRFQAMESGADDFLTKPVDRIELLIRVKSLLRIKKYSDDLIKSYSKLQEKNQQLKEIEEAREGLMHMIIHDLRSPLTIISGNLELSLIKLGTDAGARPYIEKCQHYCSYLDELIQSLLDVYRMEQGNLKLNLEEMDPWQLALETKDKFSIQAAVKGVELYLEKIGPLPPIEMDRMLISRVLANLMDNAIRHTPEKGFVKLVMDFHQEAQELRVKVTDSGEGLPEEYRDKIFDKFQQIKLKKTDKSIGSCGLGLTFSKMAVEMHGGKIWAEGQGKDQGCSFIFQIPARVKEYQASTGSFGA